jgi:signal transduction histidine kinase
MFLLREAERVNRFKNAIDMESSLLDEINTLKLRFLLDESSNYDFHKSGKSDILTKHDSLYALLESNLIYIRQQHEIKDFELESQLNNLLSDLERQESVFRQLIASIQERGFKDFGLIGEMRAEIHILEEKSEFLDIGDILMLRRHEKDFLLRNDPAYADKLNALADKLMLKFDDSEGGIKEKACLSKYSRSFNRLVDVRHAIGEFGHIGLLEKLNQKMIYLDMDMQRLSNKASEKQASIVSNFKRLFYFSVVFIILIGIALSFYLANRRSKALRDLAAAVEEKEIDIHKPELNIDISKSSTELQNLYRAFNKLLNKVSEQIITIEQKTETLEEQNAELKKVNHELDSFVYSVSHDLRSPLASTLGLIQLTRNEKDLVKIKEYNDLKEKSILKLDNFIRDIISLSRNARKELEVSRIDFNKLLDEVFENHRFYKDAERVEKIKSIKQEGEFYSDPQRLNVILNNLVSNAIRYNSRFNDKPYVDVDIRCNGQKAEITVKDNGRGISEEHLSRIFEMFYRATDENMGSGLGLYITNEALKKIEGEITVESSLGKGTTFKVLIPSLKHKMTSIQTTGEEMAV